MTGKSTINLGNVLAQLTSPMEKIAMEEEKKEETKEESKEEEKKEETKEESKEESKEETQDADKSYDKEDKSDEEKKEYKEDMNMEKEASASPVTGLEKIAQDLAEVEHNTMVKEAQVFGSVMADSFANRLSEIQDVIDTPALEKNAQENIEKIAADILNNITEEDEEILANFIKVAADSGEELSREEAVTKIAEYALVSEQAEEAEMVKLSSEDCAVIDGFVKTAHLMGDVNVNYENAYTYLTNAASERIEAEELEKYANVRDYIASMGTKAAEKARELAIKSKYSGRNAKKAIKASAGDLGEKAKGKAQEAQKALKDAASKGKDSAQAYNKAMLSDAQNAISGKRPGGMPGSEKLTSSERIEAAQKAAKKAAPYLGGAAAAGGAAAYEKSASEVEDTTEIPSTITSMEKVAAEMESNGDIEGLASLEKYAYDKGFEDTIMKVASHTSGIAYHQTEENFGYEQE